jgi:peptidoglycan/LPS O-acetylase OafA/YrhL
MVKKQVRIGVMDAVRALAIALVILSHSSASPRFPFHEVTHAFLHPGKIGVVLFFVLSGFLQTKLLLADERQLGKISLPLFYSRRLLRILPTMAVYLGFVFLWWRFTKYNGSWLEFAGTVFCFRQVFDAGGLTVHFWSLSLEVLFYLCWPVMLARCAPDLRKKMVVTSVVLLAIAPWIINAIIPDSAHFYLSRIFEVSPIFLGCWLALTEPPYSRSAESKPGLTWAYVLCCGIIFAAALYLDHVMLRAVTFTSIRLGETGEGLLAGCFVYAAMRIRSPFFETIFANPVIRFTALISFGIYVWQQFFFFGNPSDWVFAWPKKSLFYPMFWFPLNVVAACLAGALSYFLIEKQFAAVRERITHAIIQKRKPVVTSRPSTPAVVDSESVTT